MNSVFSFEMKKKTCKLSFFHDRLTDGNLAHFRRRKIFFNLYMFSEKTRHQIKVIFSHKVISPCGVIFLKDDPDHRTFVAVF